ncbi:MAG: hypothetical protein M3Z27_09110 [Actinomycetota bacterium]|nr:hypothetical protein [Actinomycetota bacterium]
MGDRLVFQPMGSSALQVSEWSVSLSDVEDCDVASVNPLELFSAASGHVSRCACVTAASSSS